MSVCKSSNTTSGCDWRRRISITCSGTYDFRSDTIWNSFAGPAVRVKASAISRFGEMRSAAMEDSVADIVQGLDEINPYDSFGRTFTGAAFASFDFFGCFCFDLFDASPPGPVGGGAVGFMNSFGNSIFGRGSLALSGSVIS